MFNKREYIVAVYHVYTADKKSRKDLLEFLELQGYECEVDNVTNRDKVLNTRLPVVVNVIDRKYSILNNVVCAAASIASNMLIEYGALLEPVASVKIAPPKSLKQSHKNRKILCQKRVPAYQTPSRTINPLTA